jgi:hypothetical protein
MSRLYEQLSVKPNFRAFIHDLLVQMGIEKKQFDVLYNPELNDTVIKEFAKCFITKAADMEYNYEVYELAGDVCVNSSVVMYLHKIIQSAQDKQLKKNPAFLPDPRMKDYFNKLKSKYISNSQYKYMAVSLGFDTFIQYHRDDNKDSADAKFIPSAFEAFFGCFEFIIQKQKKKEKDTFDYSHTYVSNFINKLMHLRYINYNPYDLYDAVTLLKETGDKTRPPNRAGFLYEANTATKEIEGQMITVMVLYRLDYKVDGKKIKPRKTIIHECGEINDVSQVGKTQMAERGLRYLYDNPQYFDRELIKRAPTPDELGISELCK